nr:dihydropteroate synthase [Sulfurirhabdus autotrophica]
MYLQCGKYRFSLERPLIMGIVNLTPDSFSDGGKLMSHQSALDHAIQLMEEGAHILDIGGESTRPGAFPVDASEELKRILPLVEALSEQNIPVSVDTHKPEVMSAAIEAGACMINDINALQSEGALRVVASSSVGVCLMHKQGIPVNMQVSPQYGDVLVEILAFLQERVALVSHAGISPDRIVIDPGFGFGKSLAHNVQLLNRLEEFHKVGVPVLAGLSRKSMLGAITGREVGGRMAASITAAVLAVQKGAKVVRVHDVKETRDALEIIHAIEGKHE